MMNKEKKISAAMNEKCKALMIVNKTPVSPVAKESIEKRRRKANLLFQRAYPAVDLLQVHLHLVADLHQMVEKRRIYAQLAGNFCQLCNLFMVDSTILMSITLAGS